MSDEKKKTTGRARVREINEARAARWATPKAAPRQTARAAPVYTMALAIGELPPGPYIASVDAAGKCTALTDAGLLVVTMLARAGKPTAKIASSIGLTKS